MDQGAKGGRNEIKGGNDDEDGRTMRVMAYNTRYGMRGGARLTLPPSQGRTRCGDEHCNELFIGALGGMSDASGSERSLRGRCVVEAGILPWQVR